ncbi:FCD domain-containing protein [Herbiconiux sp. CPCC 203407]|uniref:FCD domain-containing protein n=1 Tax=Herbiconiux oxytropis TaxID=2970915 RepID=A0AA41XBL4_9MICO|nr:FCD domain-containing protein [Herbiconiux oxytropis]MCS5720646.1 FCD domain-containing protein [Herbiconiux oxytropis]MCS5725027.1 FCD domain-containing protein [Herbiconiux oxytropis]
MAVAEGAGTPGAERSWERVLARVESDLVEGRLGPGDHLPPERALAAELGVGRSSVREGLRVLEVLGLISTSTGSGPQSGAVIVARPTGGLAALIRLQVAAQGFAVPDVVKTRVVLECAVAAELATAVRAGRQPELGAADELLDAMDAVAEGDTVADGDAVGDGADERDGFLALDQAFHRALAAASGNDVLATMMAGLRDSVETYVRHGATRLGDWPATARRLRAEHRAVLAAIRDGDPATAEARIRSHIETYHAETLVAARPQPLTTL